MADETRQQPGSRRPSVRRTAIVLALLAASIYLGFIIRAMIS